MLNNVILYRNDSDRFNYVVKAFGVAQVIGFAILAESIYSVYLQDIFDRTKYATTWTGIKDLKMIFTFFVFAVAIGECLNF